MGTQRHRALSDGLLEAGRSLGMASAMFNHAVAERLGINPTDWECLALLFDQGPVTAGRLAQLTGLTTGAITGLVDRLEAAGYVRRLRDPADRRRVIVDLVREKMAEMQPVFAPMLADMRATHTHYTDEELKAVIDAISRGSAVLRENALRIRAEVAAERRKG